MLKVNFITQNFVLSCGICKLSTIQDEKGSLNGAAGFVEGSILKKRNARKYVYVVFVFKSFDLKMPFFLETLNFTSGR